MAVVQIFLYVITMFSLQFFAVSVANASSTNVDDFAVQKLQSGSVWDVPEDREQWSVFSHSGQAHRFQLGDEQIALGGPAEEVKRSSACIRRRWVVDGRIEVAGGTATDFGPEDKWGSVVLNFFGSNGKILDGKDRFLMVAISKESEQRPFVKEVVPPEGAAHFQLCVALKAKEGRVEVRGLSVRSVFVVSTIEKTSINGENVNDSMWSQSLVVVAELEVEGRVVTKRNQTREAHELVLYTREHGLHSGQRANGIEVAVEGGIVLDIRPWGRSRPLAIPEDGYVLSGNGTSARFLKRLRLGESVRIQEENSCGHPRQGVPVLMYHRLFHEGSSDIIVSQFRDMHEAGYSSITMDDLAAFMRGQEIDLPAKPIVLTFDDGKREHYTELPTLMERYDLKAVLFGIGKQLDNPLKRYFGWEEAKELIATGRFEVLCHSYDAHRHILDPSGKKAGAYRNPTEGMGFREHELFRQADLMACREAFSDNLDVQNHHIAWPFGEYDEALVQVADQAGFVSMLTTEEGLNGTGMDPHSIRRFAVSPDMVWSEIESKIDGWRICPAPAKVVQR